MLIGRNYRSAQFGLCAHLPNDASVVRRIRLNANDQLDDLEIDQPKKMNKTRMFTIRPAYILFYSHFVTE
jgi:hypothetical protein